MANRLIAALLTVVLACMAGIAAAQSFPNKPMRIIVPLVAGGTPDMIARTLGQKLSGSLGQPVVVENRPGGSGVIAADLVLKAPADGHTLWIADTGYLAIGPAMMSKLPYEPLRDFAPVTQVVGQDFLLFVNAGVAARSLQELVALSKSRPGRLSYGSVGNGSVHHLGMERLKLLTGANLMHVPYKGVGQMVPALVAHDIDVMFSSTLPTMPHVKTGKLRALAIGAAQRTPQLPEVPTLAEAGVPGLEVKVAVGFLVRAGTAREVVQRLHAEIVKALDDPEIRRRYTDLELKIIGNTPEQFAEGIRADRELYTRVVKEASIRVD